MASLKMRIKADEFKAVTRAYMKRMKIDGAQFVRERSRLLTGTLIKWTPPRGPHPSSETWPEQKKAGENAVRRDIGKIFDSLGRFKITNPKLAKAWAKALRHRDVKAAESILRAIGVQFKQVLWAVDPKLHQQARDRRGRVRTGRFDKLKQTIIINRGSLSGYIAKIVKRVGSAKAGWMGAGRKLGLTKVPAWVTRNPASGTLVDMTKGLRLNPKMIIRSGCKYEGLEPERIVAPAITYNMHSMQWALREMERKNRVKFNRGQK